MVPLLLWPLSRGERDYVEKSLAEDWSDCLEWTSAVSSEEVLIYSFNKYFGACIWLALFKMLAL